MFKKSLMLGFVFLLFSLVLVSSVSAGCVSDKTLVPRVSGCSEHSASFDECSQFSGCVWEGDSPEGGITFNNVGLMDIIGFNPTGMLKWLSAWEKGSGVSTVFIKYLFLILVFILVLSSFNMLKFPEENYLKIILSVVVSLLFTVVISPNELIGAMINYKAAGLTMILFFPIVVLGMFSFVVASTVNAMGIVLQRVIWGIYSVFLFVNSGMVLLSKAGGVNRVDSKSFMASIFKMFDFVGGSYFATADPTVAFTLLIASIIIFLTMVVNNKFFMDLLIGEVRDSKVMKYQDTSAKSEAKKRVDASAVDNA